MINESEPIASTPVEHLKLQFFNAIRLLTLDQWLDICIRFEENEGNIIPSARKVTKLLLSHQNIIFINDEERKRMGQFDRYMHKKRIEYFLQLQETVNHNNQSYPLREFKFTDIPFLAK